MSKNYKAYTKKIPSAERVDYVLGKVKELNTAAGTKVKFDDEPEWDANEEQIIPEPEPIDGVTDVTHIYNEYGKVDGQNHLYLKYLGNTVLHPNLESTPYSKVLTGFIKVEEGEAYRFTGNVERGGHTVIAGFFTDNPTPETTSFAEGNGVRILGKPIDEYFADGRQKWDTDVLTKYDPDNDPSVKNYTHGLIKDYTFVIPEGVKYIRVCARSSKEDKDYIENCPADFTPNTSNVDKNGETKLQLKIEKVTGNGPGVDPDPDPEESSSSSSVVPTEEYKVNENPLDVTNTFNEAGGFRNVDETSQSYDDGIYHRYFNSAGNIVHPSSGETIENYLMTGYIPVNEGESFNIYGYVNPSIPVVVGFDKNKQNPVILVDAPVKYTSAVRGYNANNKLFNGTVVTIPFGKNIAYIRFAACDKGHSYFKKSNPIYLQILTQSINITKKYNNNGQAVNDFINVNTYINPQGKEVSTESEYMTTGKIPVSEDYTYVISGSVNVDVPVLIGYAPAYDAPIVITIPSSLPDSPTYNAATGVFRRYELSIPKGIKQIKIGARMSQHVDNGLHVCPSIECFKKTIEIDEFINRDFNDPNVEPIDEQTHLEENQIRKGLYPGTEAEFTGGKVFNDGVVIGDIDRIGDKIDYKEGIVFTKPNEGTKPKVESIDATTKYNDSGEEFDDNVEEADRYYYGFLRPSQAIAGAVWRTTPESTDDKYRTTGYIPIRDSEGNLLYPLNTVIRCEVYPIRTNDRKYPTCLGFKEIETEESPVGSSTFRNNNRINLLAYSQEDVTELGVKGVMTAYLRLEDIPEDVKYLRFTEDYRSWNSTKSRWESHPKMIVTILVGQGFSDFDNIEKPMSLKSVASVPTVEAVTVEEIIEEQQEIMTVFNHLKEQPQAYLDDVEYGPADRSSKIDYYTKDRNNVPVDQGDQPNIFAVKPYKVGLNPNLRYGKIHSSVYIQSNAVIPGRTNYYQLTNHGTIYPLQVVGSRRFIYGNEIENIRDLGGIKCSNDNIIAFDKIFRGSEYKGLVVTAGTDDATLYLAGIGITAELDLRRDEEITWDGHPSFITDYKRISFPNYNGLRNITTEDKDKIKEAFEFVVDCVRAGKKLYIHCSWGYHRVGLLASILEGVLGAHQSEIDKDYELSSFSKWGNAKITDDDYNVGYLALNEVYNGSWVALLFDCGVSEELVEEFRKLMLINKVGQTDGQGSYKEITYAKLVELRNNSALNPGTVYRMIDYMTDVYAPGAYIGCSHIVDLAKAVSAHHPFDLLIRAIAPNQIDCNVKAIQSARDTEGYFANQDLAKWELKYDLDNNKAKYAFAPNADLDEYRHEAVTHDKDETYDFDVYFDAILLGNENEVNQHIIFKRVAGTDNFVVVECGSHPEYLDGECVIGYNPYGRITGVTINMSEHAEVRPINVVECYKLIRVAGHFEGTGVIYNMKDERGNEAPYDFKNVTFEQGNEFVYTFNLNTDGVNSDLTMSIAENNVIKPYVYNNCMYLNNNIFYFDSDVIEESDITIVSNNVTDINAHDNKVFNCIHVTLGSYCSECNFENVEHVTLESDCNKVTVMNLEDVTVERACYNLILDPLIYDDDILIPNSVRVCTNAHDIVLSESYQPDSDEKEEIVIGPYKTKLVTV